MCHKGEASWDHIDVDFKEFEIDSDEESRYKNFWAEPAPWQREEE